MNVSIFVKQTNWVWDKSFPKPLSIYMARLLALFPISYERNTYEVDILNFFRSSIPWSSDRGIGILPAKQDILINLLKYVYVSLLS